MDNGFKKNISDKEERMVRAKAKKGMGTFAWIGMLGIIGWSITIPLLIGIALGRWLEGLFPGKYSFTLMFMFAGLAAGCYSAWRWVEKSYKNRNTEEPGLKDPDEKVKK